MGQAALLAVSIAATGADGPSRDRPEARRSGVFVFVRTRYRGAAGGRRRRSRHALGRAGCAAPGPLLPALQPAPAAGCPCGQPARRVAAHLPAWNASAGRVMDLDDRINACRVARQGAAPLARGSDDLLALTSFVAMQSRGWPVKVAIDEARRGRLRARPRLLPSATRPAGISACAGCHDRNAGSAPVGTKTIQPGPSRRVPGLSPRSAVSSARCSGVSAPASSAFAPSCRTKARRC